MLRPSDSSRAIHGLNSVLWGEVEWPSLLGNRKLLTAERIEQCFQEEHSTHLSACLPARVPVTVRTRSLSLSLSHSVQYVCMSANRICSHKLTHD